MEENETYNASIFGNSTFGGTIPEEPSIYKPIYTVLYTYVLPVIVFVGFLGNIASIFAFMGKELRNISSSVYVQAVLITDTGVLISLLFVWLEVLGYRFNHLQGVCQLLVFWQYACSFLSVWYMVCITTENYITICHPTKISTMCTVLRAKIVTVALAVIAFSLYIVSVFITGPSVHPNGTEFCVVRPDYILITTILTYGDSCITLLIPVVIIILMLSAILLSIVQSLKNKRKRTVNRKNKKTSIPQVRVAKMLLCLSLSFVIMNVPSHTIKLYFLFVNSGTISYMNALIQLIFLFVSYLNFSVKYFLFTACSSNFRNAQFSICQFQSAYRGIAQK